jgi:hypothetical protein
VLECVLLLMCALNDHMGGVRTGLVIFKAMFIMIFTRMCSLTNVFSNRMCSLLGLAIFKAMLVMMLTVLLLMCSLTECVL